jgi:hypothetical protein
LKYRKIALQSNLAPEPGQDLLGHQPGHVWATHKVSGCQEGVEVFAPEVFDQLHLKDLSRNASRQLATRVTVTRDEIRLAYADGEQLTDWLEKLGVDF